MHSKFSFILRDMTRTPFFKIWLSKASLLVSKLFFVVDSFVTVDYFQVCFVFACFGELDYSLFPQPHLSYSSQNSARQPLNNTLACSKSPASEFTFVSRRSDIEVINSSLDPWICKDYYVDSLSDPPTSDQCSLLSLSEIVEALADEDLNLDWWQVHLQFPCESISSSSSVSLRPSSNFMT